jgi:hypothetical protein
MAAVALTVAPWQPQRVKVKRTPTGAQLLQGGAILSEIRSWPGPTHSLFDVLAAAIAVFGDESPVALLGFAGGGVVAPLRALGCRAPIMAVDVELFGERIFRELSADWAGDVRVEHEDAALWLQRTRRTFRVVCEDLSVLGVEGETKPAVTVTALPELIARRLSPDGVAIVNLLPVAGVSWRALTAQVVAPFATARVITVEGFENRIILAAARLPEPDAVAQALRARLAALRSRAAHGIAVRLVRARRAGTIRP